MKPEPTERDRLAMEPGHPPEAHRVVCVDFDGVLYPFGMLIEAPPPIEGAVKAMQRLKASGFRIVVLTSRLSPTWLRASGPSAPDQREYVSRVLTSDGIPYDTITEGHYQSDNWLSVFTINGEVYREPGQPIWAAQHELQWRYRRGGNGQP